MQHLRWRFALIVGTCITVAFILLLVFNDKGWLDVRARAKHLTDIESQIRDIEAKNQGLTDEIQALRSDPATIEKIAREQLKLVKPGELVIVVPEEKSPPEQK